MNKNPLTVLTVFGTRPEVIKLFPVLDELRRNAQFKSIVISTSQHREMIDDLFILFSIKPDHDLNIIRKNQSLGDISARSLSRLCPYLRKYSPDLVLVQGDTTSAFAGALAAFYHKIPVGHVEAGLRSFNNRHPFPEEINRKLISTVSTLHFSPTQRNAENLYKEGIHPTKVYVTGNTSIDSLQWITRRKKSSFRNYVSKDILNSHRLILVTAHRRENWGKPLKDLCYALKDLVRLHPDIQVVYPVHLNPKVRETVFSILPEEERIHLLNPLPYKPFVELMAKAHFIITDSGGIQEEGVSLRKPILVFREVTERQEAVLNGSVKVVGRKRENLVREASKLLNGQQAYQKMIAGYCPFGDGYAARRIIEAILHHFKRGRRPQDFMYPSFL